MRPMHRDQMLVSDAVHMLGNENFEEINREK